MVAPVAASAQASDGAGSGLLGGWLITHKSPTSDPTGTQATVTYAAGGALSTVDINPVGTNGQGTWAPDGSHGFEGTFWSAATGGPVGAPPATVRVKIHGTFTDDGHITGRFSAAIFVSGTQVATDQGTFAGNRIEP